MKNYQLINGILLLKLFYIYRMMKNCFKDAAATYTLEFREEKIAGQKENQKKLFCSCMESIFDGFPCRHELALCIMKFKSIDALHFQPRWRQDFLAMKIRNHQLK